MTIDDDNQDKEIAEMMEKLGLSDGVKVKTNLDENSNSDIETRLKILELFAKDTVFALLVNVKNLYAHVLINSSVKYSPELSSNFAEFLGEMNRIIDAYYEEFKPPQAEEQEESQDESD
jgi:hypothetical protein